MCLDHMRLAVKGLMAVNSSISMHFPGMAVMLQLLGGASSSPVMVAELRCSTPAPASEIVLTALRSSNAGLLTWMQEWY